MADAIEFDLPPTAVAKTIAVENQAPERSRIEFELRLSSLVARPQAPKIDQWLVTCRPRQTHWSIVDYAPKTETDSDVLSPISVKRTNERSDSIGLSVESSYEKLVGAQFGIDQSEKDTDSVSYDKRAQVQAVTAAGTIHRGSGVYFKLRWTAAQVLEGEKVFRIVMDVPQSWRGELVDVSVRAHTSEPVFGGLDRKTIQLGAADFVVAVYRGDDDQAQQHANQLARAERQLRKTAHQVSQEEKRNHSFSDLFRHISRKFDSSVERHWLSRVLAGQADVHHDREITKLPMEIRTAALDYVDAREEFAQLSTHSG